MNKGFFGLLMGVVVMLSGCTQTLKMNSSVLPVSGLIESAPEGRVDFKDLRSDDYAGKIGAGKIRVTTADLETMVRAQAAAFLNQRGFNANADSGDFVFEVSVNDISVSSFDLLFEQPKYVFQGILTVSDRSGKRLYREKLYGEHGERDLTNKGLTVSFAKIIQYGLESVEKNDEFQSVLSSLK